MNQFILHPSSFILSRAVSFLLHFPGPSASTLAGAGMGRWVLPTTASYGARTFLSPVIPPPGGSGLPGSDRPAGL